MEIRTIEPYGYIYLTVNKINKKMYVGQHSRMTNKKYLGSGKILKRAIKKYGRDNFPQCIIAYGYSQEELDFLERFYIEKFNATSDQRFYNISTGGLSGNNYSGLTEEQRIAIRLKKNMSTYKTEEFKEKTSEVTSGKKNGMHGKKHSEESKQKMSKNRKGLTTKEKNGMYGKRGMNAVYIYQYEDESHKKLLNRFNSQLDALKYLNLKGHLGLNKAMKDNTMYKGYYWAKQEENVETISQESRG